MFLRKIMMMFGRVMLRLAVSLAACTLIFFFVGPLALAHLQDHLVLKNVRGASPNATKGLPYAACLKLKDPGEAFGCITSEAQAHLDKLNR